MPTPSEATSRATDDAQLVERIGQAVTVVPGSPLNMKITTKEDQRFGGARPEGLAKAETAGAHESV